MHRCPGVRSSLPWSSVPHRYGDGTFPLADPKLGRAQHLASNAIRVRSETEAADFLRRGFSVWMGGKDTNKVNLIRRQHRVLRTFRAGMRYLWSHPGDRSDDNVAVKLRLQIQKRSISPRSAIT